MVRLPRLGAQTLGEIMKSLERWHYEQMAINASRTETPKTDGQLILQLTRERDELAAALLELADQFCATHGPIWMQVTKNKAYHEARALLARLKGPETNQPKGKP